ncbi:MAG: GtrA family protein [Myxococcales bacterium]|nr:GtrA family protein [Myxococcales bacterium]
MSLIENLRRIGDHQAAAHPTLHELAKFCTVGLIGLFIDLTTVVAVKEGLGLDTRLCAVLGFCVTVSSNYALNRRFTFTQARQAPLLPSYLAYVGANLLGLGVRVVIIHSLMVWADLDRGYGYVLSNAIGIVLATLVNYAGAKFIAFGRIGRGTD